MNYPEINSFRGINPLLVPLPCLNTEKLTSERSEEDPHYTIFVDQDNGDLIREEIFRIPALTYLNDRNSVFFLHGEFDSIVEKNNSQQKIDGRYRIAVEMDLPLEDSYGEIVPGKRKKKRVECSLIELNEFCKFSPELKSLFIDGIFGNIGNLLSELQIYYRFMKNLKKRGGSLKGDLAAMYENCTQRLLMQLEDSYHSADTLFAPGEKGHLLIKNELQKEKWELLKEKIKEVGIDLVESASAEMS
ncbi:MAG TPA: hypothetical protein VLF89_07745 [Candidatus Saccharimonadales bacterium]|nr:hypothetical protein [Candidatus Saccharimonadales bacterium]